MEWCIQRMTVRPYVYGRGTAQELMSVASCHPRRLMFERLLQLLSQRKGSTVLLDLDFIVPVFCTFSPHVF